MKLVQFPYFQRLRAYLNYLIYFLPLREKINWLDLLALARSNKSEIDDLCLLTIRLRKPSKRKIYIRKFSKTDKSVFKYVFFNQYHQSPIALKDDCTILDLGANIGLTMVDFKQVYPQSKVWGFEMDKKNYFIAQKNLEGLTDCHIENIAVWDTTRIVRYATDVDEDAYNISEQRYTEGWYQEVEAWSLDDILEKFDLKTVDYIKMDIEGAEKVVLRNGERNWLKQVNCMNIEIHDSYFIEEAMGILEDFGFICQKDTNHWSAILAIRAHQIH